MNISPTLPELQGILTDPDLFSSMDKHFAMFIARLALEHRLEAAIGAALVSRETGNGSICLDIAEFADKPLGPTGRQDIRGAFVCPTLSEWTEKLLLSGVVSRGENETPLVLGAGNRLYLRRYWNYEKVIVNFIRQRISATPAEINYSRLDSDLKKLFQPLSGDVVDWQQIAAVAAVTRLFCVVSGGPGTGKTSTVVRILALLAGQYRDNKPLRILLGAPTGKAASRLQQTIAASGTLLQTGSDPPQVTTLHRMLGFIPGSPYFRHNADNPLAADVVVIDEASMVDMPLMAKLMQAVSGSTRLILLGDRHQLASVQPGSVLGDICQDEVLASFSAGFIQRISDLTGNIISPAPHSRAPAISPALPDSFVQLEQNYRFAPESAIAKLSKAIKQGDGDGALEILLQSDDDSASWADVPDAAEIGKKLRHTSGVARFIAMQQVMDPDSCFELLDNFRILCALRGGPYGMENVNTVIEQHLAQQLRPESEYPFADMLAKVKKGLAVHPIMVTRNDYNLQLFNGDIGFILPDRKNRGSFRAFFRDEAGQLHDSNPSLLPSHETVFAMTVHKSQGSEFDRILLILPDQDTPLLTRELLYTAITRARKKVEIWGRKDLFAAAVKRRIKRTSGLAEALWD